jgi:hypothetical protein
LALALRLILFALLFFLRRFCKAIRKILIKIKLSLTAARERGCNTDFVARLIPGMPRRNWSVFG